jgi:hypothetical protein
METFLKDAKEHGDHVRLWACAATLASAGLSVGDLVPFLDGAMEEEGFLKAAAGADALLRF